MVDVTNRAIQGRFLLRPSKELNEIALGVVGRAQRLYEIELFGLTIMSNHFHLLAWVEESDQTTCEEHGTYRPHQHLQTSPDNLQEEDP
jgi:hypothetical protein